MNVFPCVEFPVVVDGKRKTARVLRPIDSPLYYIYQVAFSDGFEDEFTINDELGIPEGTKPQAEEYAKALAQDLPLVMFISDHRYNIFQDKIHGKATNIWVIGKEPEVGEVAFEVFYNGRYRFELYRQHGQTEWQVTTRQIHKPVLPETIVQRVRSLLDTMV